MYNLNIIKMEKRTIRYRLNQVKQQQEIIEKTCKFLKTKRGPKIVKDLEKYNVVEVCNKNNMKFFLYRKNTTYLKNLLIYCINKTETKPHKYKIYAGPLYEKREVKIPVRLTKKEIKLIESKRPKMKLGRAGMLHAYEVAKIAKWERRHPKPTDTQLQEDLFPETLITGWETARTIALENIRNMLCQHYLKTPEKEKGLQLRAVYKINGVESEVEQYDAYAFKLPQVYNQAPATILDRLKLWAQSKPDNRIIGAKLYDYKGECLYKVAA